jgi:hypothetical protein
MALRERNQQYVAWSDGVPRISGSMDRQTNCAQMSGIDLNNLHLFFFFFAFVLLYLLNRRSNLISATY